MKKVLVVIDNLNRGGVATVALNISKAMDKNLFVFDYITYIKPNKEVSSRLSKMNSKVNVIKRLSETTPFNYINEIRKVIKSNGPYEVMHAHTSSFIWLACLAAKMEKIPVRVGHAHGSKNVRQFLFSEGLYSTFRFMNRRFCTKMITCAETSGKYVFGKNFEFIPNFIDHNKYNKISDSERITFMKKYGIPQSATKYCFIGHLGGEKNPIFALDIFNTILKDDSNSVLLVAGDGPERNLLMDFILSNNITERVFMFGNTNEVKEILQVSDIMLMPSFSEGMSIVAIEAQILGVNCIVSKGVPNTNDIKAGLFHLCDSFDIDLWFKKIKQVLYNRCEISRNEIIESLINIGYDKGSVVNRLEDIYLK